MKEEYKIGQCLVCNKTKALKNGICFECVNLFYNNPSNIEDSTLNDFLKKFLGLENEN